MSDPTIVFVQIYGNGKLEFEQSLIEEAAAARGIPLQRASLKQLERNRLKLEHGAMAIGSFPFIAQALRQLHKRVPEHTPYPPELNKLLYRRVARLPSLSAARRKLADGESFFIKPADGWKRFTGFVANFETDIRFNGMSQARPVWIADPVRFASEWRVCVASHGVLDMRFVHGCGDCSIEPDRAVIEDAVRLLAANPDTPAGYCIDFGVLDSGETALVEMNDGFAFGAYEGMPAEVYWEVTLMRWQQIMRDTSLDIVGKLTRHPRWNFARSIVHN